MIEVPPPCEVRAKILFILAHCIMSPKNPFQFFNQNGNRKVADLCFLSKNQPLVSHSRYYCIFARLFIFSSKDIPIIGIINANIVNIHLNSPLNIYPIGAITTLANVA